MAIKTTKFTVTPSVTRTGRVTLRRSLNYTPATSNLFTFDDWAALAATYIPPPPKSTPHDILGVPKDASPSDIKRAYRAIAFATHPDRNPGDAAAAQRFIEATAAYDILRSRR